MCVCRQDGSGDQVVQKICMCVRVCAYVYTDIRLYMCVYICTYIYTHTHILTYLFTNIYTYIRQDVWVIKLCKAYALVAPSFCTRVCGVRVTNKCVACVKIIVISLKTVQSNHHFHETFYLLNPRQAHTQHCIRAITTSGLLKSRSAEGVQPVPEDTPKW